MKPSGSKMSDFHSVLSLVIHGFFSSGVLCRRVLRTCVGLFKFVFLYDLFEIPGNGLMTVTVGGRLESWWTGPDCPSICTRNK